MAVKDVLRKYNEVSLVKRILIGLVVGALLGLFAPKDMEVVTLLGTLFVSALKAVAPVLVFFLVISALANAKAAGSMKTVVLLYLVSTLVASLVAVVAICSPPRSRWWSPLSSRQARPAWARCWSPL